MINREFPPIIDGHEDFITAIPRQERDFLEELQRQREETADGDDVAARQDAEPATAGARAERSVGEPVPVKRPSTYDADDLEIPSFLRRK